MVYFDSGLIQIPRHTQENPTKMTLTNELTNDVIEVVVIDMSDNPRSYVFDLSDLELMNGTYRYNLGSETGLLQVGDYVSVVKEYNNKRNSVVYEG